MPLVPRKISNQRSTQTGHKFSREDFFIGFLSSFPISLPGFGYIPGRRSQSRPRPLQWWNRKNTRRFHKLRLSSQPGSLHTLTLERERRPSGSSVSMRLVSNKQWQIDRWNRMSHEGKGLTQQQGECVLHNTNRGTPLALRTTSHPSPKHPLSLLMGGFR